MLRITFIIPFFLLAATICGLAAERLTVAYHLPLGVVGGWAAEPKKIEGSPPFASRFLKTGDQLLSLAGDYPELIKSGGHAIYNETRSVFVVNATPDQQIELHERFESQVPIQLQSSFQLIRIPEVSINLIEDDPKKLPASEVFADLSFLSTRHGVFQAQSSAGDFKVSGEVEGERCLRFSHIKLALNSTISGAEFEIKTDFTTHLGQTHIIPLGSMDGLNSLLLFVRYEFVLPSGRQASRWAETESGDPLPERVSLASARREVLGKNPDWKAKALRLFDAPKTIPALIAGDIGPEGTGGLSMNDAPSELDPFLAMFGQRTATDYGPRWINIYNAKGIFTARGVTFAEGEFIVWQQGTNLIWAKAAPAQLQLIEGIIKGDDQSKLTNMKVALTLVKSQKELTQDDLGRGGFEVIKQLALRGSRGEGVSSLLEKRISAEVKLIDQDTEGEFLEARVLVSEVSADPEADSVELVKASMILRKDVPIIIQQSYDGENWLAWIAVARMTIFEDGSKMKTRSSD